MKNYIIRVYRQDEEDLNLVVGIVEDVEEERQDSFTSMGELMKILCSQKKIVSELTEDELEEMIRSSFKEKDHTGRDFNLADLKRPSRGETGDGPGED